MYPAASESSLPSLSHDIVLAVGITDDKIISNLNTACAQTSAFTIISTGFCSGFSPLCFPNLQLHSS